MSFNIEIQSGTSARLPTAGKYCDRDIVVTAAENHAVEDALIRRAIEGDYTNDRVTSIGGYAFINCRELGNVFFPKVTNISNLGFQSCTNMKVADFPMLKSMSASAFAYCTGLRALILRRTDAICTIANTNVFSNSSVKNGNGYVYVPKALVEQYKTETNWSTYASQIRAIEDYPEICG